MRKITTILILSFIAVNSIAQVVGGYTLHIQQDTAIQWAAESDKMINLTPKVQAYRINNSGDVVSSYQFSMPLLTTQEWLKGLSIEIPPFNSPKEWYFYDKTLAKENYDRYKYRVGNQKFSTDSCCGCDEADAFRVKQILDYKKGIFSIYNVFISPLCARQTGTIPIEWYPMCNVAYNDNADRKFPGLSKDVVLLNTDEVDYEFSRENPSLFDSVLTVYRTDIGSLIYQDILEGTIKPIDIETGKQIPVKKFLTWEMPTDTLAVYDINDPSKITEYRVVQAERSSSEFSRLRIKQDIYFDFKNERLYSVIRSVIILMPVKSYDGSIRGYMQYCKIF
jgi:hypothetical protein